MSRLDALRGQSPPVDHNARSIAALAANPACHRRAVLDAAGINKGKLVERLGYPMQFGQSPFALTRSRQFKEIVKADGGAHLLRLLRGLLALSVEEAGYTDVAQVDENGARGVLRKHTENLLRSAAENRGDAATIVDHPLLKLDVAGYDVYLEPDVIAFQAQGKFFIVTIKTFATIDGQAESGKVSAAARESAVYVHAMRRLFDQLGLDPGLVSHDVVLVCPENFRNFPTAVLVDVRHQLEALRRQLERLTRIDAILDLLPHGLSLDLQMDGDTSTRSAKELNQAVSEISARYAPECLSVCEMAYFCRHEARACGSLEALGRAVRDDLGGIESVSTVTNLLTGVAVPSDDQIPLVERLRYVHRIHGEVVA